MTQGILNLNEEDQKMWKGMRIYATMHKNANMVYDTQPWLMETFYAITPVRADGLKTAGVDKFFRCYIDFDYIRELAKQKGINPSILGGKYLSHEVWHLLRNHHERGENLPEPPDGIDKNKLSNIAEDLEINDDIRHILLPELSFACFPGQEPFEELPDGKSMEFYYDKLCSEIGKNPELLEQVLKEAQIISQNNDIDGDNDSSNQAKNESGDTPQSNGCAGSIDPADWGLSSEAGKDEALSKTAIENIIRSTAQNIQDWEKQHGTSPLSSANEWAGFVLGHKKVNWRIILRNAIKKATLEWQRGQVDYVRTRPARRQIVKNAILPALRAPKLSAAIALDVSGSNVGNLADCLEEVQNIMQSLQIRGKDLMFFAVDIDATKPEPVSNPKTLLEHLPVGGGTLMAPGYQQLGALGKSVSILITDGYVIDYPKTRPSGKGNTKFVTCLVGTKQELEEVYQDTLDQISNWSLVVPIEINS